MATEEWRPVVGYEGLYEVSDQGRVRGVPRKGSAGGVLKPHVGNRGYLTVNPCVNSKNKTVPVHKLVTEAFIGPRPDGMQVRHLNGNRQDARLVNLAYGTPSENVIDSVNHGTHAKTAKRACPSGHEYSPENTYSPPSRPNARYCRSCDRARSPRRRVAA